jgi:uncharacterized protein
VKEVDVLKVRTRLAASAIHGIGLFADEPIPAGTVIWEFDPHFDIAFSGDDLASLSLPTRAQVEKYAYFESELGAYVLCGDDARFMNHSPSPNTEDHAGMRTVAGCFIAAGDEITCDYDALGVALGSP